MSSDDENKQEEESQVDKLLGDKGWVAVQIKAYTAWLNQTLAHRSGLPMANDIGKDLQDGILLINFLEILHGKSLKDKWEKKPSFRIQKIQNAHLALVFSERDMGVKNSGIGAEEIVDTNVKLVLGFLYSLYRKYRLEVIKSDDGKSVEDSLLFWIRETTQGYEHVNIESYKESFKDGMAFLALTHAFNPEDSKVKYDSYSPADPKKNLEDAFAFAESELGVQRLLDVDEVLSGTCDERSMVLYNSLFFHAFKAEKDRREMEAERLAKERELEEERKRQDSLEVDNKKLWEEVEELSSLIEKSEASKQYFLQRDEKFTKMLKSMTKKEKIAKSEKEQLLAEIAQLEKDIKELKEKLETILANESDTQKKMTEQLHDAAKKAAQLQEMSVALEMEGENYKNQIASLKKQLKKETKNRENRTAEVEANSSREVVQLNGLAVLKLNMDRHIDDINRWKDYLERDKKAGENLNFEIADHKLESSDKLEFQKQLEILSSSLIKENMEMVRVLADQEVLYKQREEDRKKREAKKKRGALLEASDDEEEEEEEQPVQKTPKESSKTKKPKKSSKK